MNGTFCNKLFQLTRTNGLFLLGRMSVALGQSWNAFFSETEKGISQLQSQLRKREQELAAERNLRRHLEKQLGRPRSGDIMSNNLVVEDLVANNNNARQQHQHQPFAYF